MKVCVAIIQLSIKYKFKFEDGLGRGCCTVGSVLVAQVELSIE